MDISEKTQKSLLLKPLDKKMKGGSGAISKRPFQDHAPLSFGQERLWFLWQMAPQSTAYNLVAAIRLTGLMDEKALEWSFDELE